MKDLKNLKGAKLLSKNQQKSIKGGVIYECSPSVVCNSYANCCIDGECGRLNNGQCYPY